jgi:hypothetical protein
MQQHPEFMLDMVQQRQARVRAEVIRGRSRVKEGGPSLVRRQLGSVLIVLGQWLVGASSPAQTLPGQLALTTAHR